MTRVYVICEGVTEEAFVKKILQEALAHKDVFLSAVRIGKPGHKGGNVKFDRLLPDIRTLLRQDRAAYCTSLIDFYGLSSSFPGKEEAASQTTNSAKAACLYQIFGSAVKEKLGEAEAKRFIPYVQMYEFEALLFSDPETFASSLGQPELAGQLRAIRDNFSSPEDINDSPHTAPSKRIEKLYSSYKKPLNGSIAASEIGLDVIRRECCLFNDWMRRLESLSA